MSTLIRWDPFRVQWNPLKERDELENRLSTLLGHRASTGNGGKEALTVAKAELPAMKKEDVRLTVDNGVLTISGERKYEQEEKREKHHRIERAYGSFVRSFSLPEDADGSKVTADYKDGVLHVHLPKSEKAKPKSIEIKVS